MPSESLAAALARAGSPVELLRNLSFPPSTFPVQPEFTNWRSEQRSWVETCALLDQSHHMTDLFIEGPDALRLLSDVGVNTFANFGVGKAKQFVAVNPDGYLIGDAILFHLEEELFDLVGHPMVIDWVTFNLERGDYQATVERDDNSAVRASGPPRLYRYELQGPTAAAIVEQVSGAPLPDVKFFNMAEFEIAGRRVRGLRHGMAGQPGFELFGPWKDSDAVLAALLEAGKDHGLVRVGAKAYSTANLESGWVPAPLTALFSDDPLMQEYREWLPVDEGRLASAAASTRPTSRDYYLTPYEIGYGKTVKFDHEFIGRAALERMASTGGDAVAHQGDPGLERRRRHRGDRLALPARPRRQVHRAAEGPLRHPSRGQGAQGRPGGRHLPRLRLPRQRARDGVPRRGRPELAEPGTEVTVLWGEQPNSAKPAVEEHRQVEIRATVAPVPFVDFARENYRSR